MPAFRFEALDASGKTVNGLVEADNPKAARTQLRAQQLVPLKVDNWGMMLNLATFQSGALYVPRAWAYLLSPLVAIVTFQFCLIQLASGVEELVDPRLRRRA